MLSTKNTHRRTPQDIDHTIVNPNLDTVTLWRWGVTFHYCIYTRRCWCAGCELLSDDGGNVYSRHGNGTCNYPCEGDSSYACGGYYSFSLYKPGNCGTSTTVIGGGKQNIRLFLMYTWWPFE